MRFLSVLLALVLLPGAAFADRYNIDKSHTAIMFSISHLGYSNTIGMFTDYDGGFVFDEKAPEKSSVEVVLRPAGIRTSSAELDKHLQAEKFFNTAQHPEIRFVSKKINVTSDRTGDITGDLTMLGVTKPVTLRVTFNKADFQPMSGNFIAGFSAETTIKRSEFGMDHYVPMVGDEVKITIETEGISQDRKKDPAGK